MDISDDFFLNDPAIWAIRENKEAILKMIRSESTEVTHESFTKQRALVDEEKKAEDSDEYEALTKKILEEEEPYIAMGIWDGFNAKMQARTEYEIKEQQEKELERHMAKVQRFWDTCVMKIWPEFDRKRNLNLDRLFLTETLSDSVVLQDIFLNDPRIWNIRDYGVELTELTNEPLKELIIREKALRQVYTEENEKAKKLHIDLRDFKNTFYRLEQYELEELIEEKENNIREQEAVSMDKYRELSKFQYELKTIITQSPQMKKIVQQSMISRDVSGDRPTFNQKLKFLREIMPKSTMWEISNYFRPTQKKIDAVHSAYKKVTEDNVLHPSHKDLIEKCKALKLIK